MIQEPLLTSNCLLLVIPLKINKSVCLLLQALFSAAVSQMSGPVEIVANSAGIYKEFEWERTVNVNVVRPLLMNEK